MKTLLKRVVWVTFGGLFALIVWLSIPAYSGNCYCTDQWNSKCATEAGQGYWDCVNSSEETDNCADFMEACC